MHREFRGKFNLVRTTKVYRLHIKQYICDKLFVNRQFWKIHSADLSKVPHRYAAMLTIYTRLVHPHILLSPNAQSCFPTRERAILGRKPYPCRMKNSNRSDRLVHQLLEEYRKLRCCGFVNENLRLPKTGKIP